MHTISNLWYGVFIRIQSDKNPHLESDRVTGQLFPILSEFCIFGLTQHSILAFDPIMPVCHEMPAGFNGYA